MVPYGFVVNLLSSLFLILGNPHTCGIYSLMDFIVGMSGMSKSMLGNLI